MSWGAQNRSEDAKTPSGSRGRSEKPELDRCPIQPYMTTVDSKSVGRFDHKLAVQRVFPSEQLKSQLPQAKKLATRQLVPYIVRDGQWQCGIRPTAP
jgi:hypothetical protein